MGAKPRILAPELPCHVMARGNNRGRVFFDDDDRRRFLVILGRIFALHEWSCHAYCLMDNHYHLVVQAPGPTLPVGMREINRRYAQQFNRRHGRSGHVFQGRYRAVPVEDDAQFMQVCRYVALNPVRGGICRDPSEWPWSSYRGTAGEVRDPLLSRSGILPLFSATTAEANAAYRRFVLAEVDTPAVAGGQRSDAIDGVARRPASRPVLGGRGRDPRRLQPSLSDIFASEPNPISVAYEMHGYLLHEIATHLGCHRSTVSRRLTRESNGAVRVAG